MFSVRSAALVAAFLLVPAVAPASAGAQATQKLRACVKKKSGKMRMLVKPKQRKCRRRERRVTWNATGVQGLPGPKGDPGPVEGTPAGGALTGAYPNPMLADGVVGAAQIAAVLLDPAPGVPGLRTLGTGAQQAVAGDDARLSDARTPTGPAGGALAGSYPDPALAADSVDSATVSDRSLRLTDVAVLNTTVTANLGSIAAHSCFDTQFGFAAVDAGDIVVFAVPAHVDPRLHIPVRSAAAADQLPFTLCNMAAVPLDPPSAVYPVSVLRRAQGGGTSGS